MGKWLTDKARLEQTNIPNKWLVVDNELYQDDDGSIYLVPRNYITDNYTVPDPVVGITGGRAKWDTRPSHLHDTICTYHMVIKVNLTELQLRRMGYLCVFKCKQVCEDIPATYLSLVPLTGHECNNFLYRAMLATKVIPKRVCKLYRFGTCFNIGWFIDPVIPLDITKLYTIEQNYK